MLLDEGVEDPPRLGLGQHKLDPLPHAPLQLGVGGRGKHLVGQGGTGRGSCIGWKKIVEKNKKE